MLQVEKHEMLPWLDLLVGKLLPVLLLWLDLLVAKVKQTKKAGKIGDGSGGSSGGLSQRNSRGAVVT